MRGARGLIAITERSRWKAKTESKKGAGHAIEFGDRPMLDLWLSKTLLWRTGIHLGEPLDERSTTASRTETRETAK